MPPLDLGDRVGLRCDADQPRPRPARQRECAHARLRDWISEQCSVALGLRLTSIVIAGAKVTALTPASVPSGERAVPSLPHWSALALPLRPGTCRLLLEFAAATTPGFVRAFAVQHLFDADYVTYLVRSISAGAARALCARSCFCPRWAHWRRRPPLRLPPQLPRSASYPTKPIRLVVPFPAGGSLDVVARAIGQKLTEAWGQPVIIDNRPGAGGNIGADLVAKSAPDGYTILEGALSTHAVNVSLYAKMPYDPIKDFAPITLVAVTPNVLVLNPSVPGQFGAGADCLRQGQSGQACRSAPAAMAAPAISPASCSRPRPASTWFTSPTRAARRRCRICSAATSS